MVLSGMVIFTFVVPLAGWVSDKGVGRVSATMWVSVVAGEHPRHTVYLEYVVVQKHCQGLSQ
jgi:hypothetical protein